jgi:large subunit ribosomal protein L23
MELKIIPLISEKSYAQAQTGTYVFNIPSTASKLAVKNAVAKQYSVEVTSVTTAITKGKVKRSYRKGGAWTKGTRKDSKKAYVRLAKGQTIPVFNNAEAEKPAAAKEKK